MICVSRLGKFGRFGNSLFQYCFAKGYAESKGEPLHVPADWYARQIFEIDDPAIPAGDMPPCYGFDSIPKTNHCDIHGYYQYQDALDFYSAEKTRGWLRLKPRWLKALKGIDTPYTAFHIRRGDYKSYSHLYCIPTAHSYLKCYEAHPEVPRFIIYVGDETPVHDQGVPDAFAFLPDFVCLLRAGCLLRANSSFSWWAATLGGMRVFSPDVGSKTGEQDVPFVEGNHPWFADVRANEPQSPGTFTELRLKER
jgi:hypothetical protein